MAAGRSTLRLLAAILVLSAFAMVPARAQSDAGGGDVAAEQSVVVRQAVDGVVAVTIESARLELLLEVVPAGTADVVGIRVDVTRLHIAGTAISAATDLLLDEAPFDPFDPAAPLLTLESGRERSITVRADLPRPGVYDGAITFVVGSNRHTTVLAVTYTQPPLMIEDATDGAIAVSVESAAFDLDVRAVPTGSSNLEGVTVDAGRLTIHGTTTSAPIAIEVDGAPIDPENPGFAVPAPGGRTVSLTATLPMPGTYVGAIVLIQGSTRVRTSLAVTYGDPPLPTVVVDPVGVVRGRSFDVTVRETGHRRVVLDPPALVSPRMELSDTVDEAVLPTSFTVSIVERGGVLRPVGEQIELGPDDSVTLRMTINGLDRPGSYEVDLRMATGGAEKGVTTTITLLRRRSPLAAFGILILGIALAEILRRVALVDRPRLEAQIVVGQWVANLRGVVDGLPADQRLRPEVERAVAAMERQLSDLSRRIATGEIAASSATSETSSFGPRLRFLERWSAVIVDSVDAGVLGDAAKDMATTSEHIGSGAWTADEAEKALVRLRDRAGAGLSVAVATALVELLAARKGHVPDDAENERKEAETQARDALSRLGEAKFSDARAAYDRARSTWTRTVANVAISRIDVTPPIGVGDSRWDDLVTMTQAAVENPDPDTVEAALWPVFERYGTLIVEAIEKALVTAPQATPAERTALDLAVTELRSAMKYGVGTEVARRADEAVKAFEPFRPTLPQARSFPVPAGGAEGGRRFAGKVVAEPRRVLRDQYEHATAEADLDSVRKRLRQLDRRLVGFSTLIAGLFGMLLFYHPNLSWGSLEEMLTLFLWALGVHQVTGVTGSVAIRKSVRTGLETTP